MGLKNQIVTIYTDGACSGNPGPGGWGALLEYNGVKKEIYGSELKTTNNRMELKAVIEALKALKKSSKVDLYTDSKYVCNGITEWIKGWKAKNWKKSDNKPVLNVELWQELDGLIEIHQVSFYWVKGHADNLGNQIADRLAVKGRDEASQKISF